MENIQKLEIARAITKVENDHDSAVELLNSLWKKGGKAYRIGITGPPGAGKSSLVEKLALQFREEDLSVAIIMVDPSSPFTGGALLGDRLRMNALSADPDIFIRSMATRGSLGGLSIKTQDVCDILDGYGFDIILIETVGVGQIELDIAQSSDVTVVVLVPESGDDIQAMKAGLMEISNIFAINKADRDGAEKMLINLNSMLEMKNCPSQWMVPVVKTIAIRNEGISELKQAIMDYKVNLEKTDFWQTLRNTRKLTKTQELIKETVMTTFWTDEKKATLDKMLETQSNSPFDIKKALLKL